MGEVLRASLKNLAFDHLILNPSPMNSVSPHPQPLSETERGDDSLLLEEKDWG